MLNLVCDVVALFYAILSILQEKPKNDESKQPKRSSISQCRPQFLRTFVRHL